MATDRADHRPAARRRSESTDIALSAYAMLRGSPSGWRSMLTRLARPAIRLHGLRNARTRMWREALRQHDNPCL